MTDPIRTRVEIPHNDAPGPHEYMCGLMKHGEFADGSWWQLWICDGDGCPGRLLVREDDIEQLVNDATKEQP